MEQLINFFQHIQSWQRLLMLAGGIVFFWALEGLIPLFDFHYKKVRHAGLNIVFTLTTVLINFAFAALIVWASNYTGNHRLGLLYVFHLHLWLFILAGIGLLDLISAWFIHWILHQAKWMWKFHIIHHSDTWVDTTTANRHHPGESVFRAIFTLIAVLISGAPLWLVFFYQFLSVLFSQFNHANISLPKWLDKIICWVFVSPDMHKVHHHYKQPLTDKNYGNIFSFWDRLFRTFTYVKDVKTVQYGIDTYMKEEENNRISRLFEIPFGEYRPPEGGKFR